MHDNNIIASIGLPVFNGERYIREALVSILAQTFADFEVIISDNGSTDQTEKICREYADKDSRIRYIRQPENRGIHFNGNFVLQEAKGKYFTWLAHDDALKNDFLEKTVNYMSLHDSCFIVASDFESIDQYGKKIRIEKLDKIRDHIPWPRRCLEFFRYPMDNVYFCIYGLFRTEKAKAVYKKMRHSKMMAGSELPILARFAIAGEIASIPIALRKYRRHSGSAYHTEINAINKKPLLIKYFINLANLYSLRFDQIKVLIISNLPLSQKIKIIILVHLGYLKSFLGRLIRLLKNYCLKLLLNK